MQRWLSYIHPNKKLVEAAAMHIPIYVYKSANYFS